ncbi:MAG: FAD-dependent oxidoreductase [Candidatus Thermoplasmatota archaeon]|nr:FAD-dependent oxidoreductase [Candidatus Thermoplasmatota archaeon]
MKVIIVGNNAAGTTAAKGTRDASQEAEIEIFTEEPVPYYPRPKLIDFIAGAIDEKDILFNPVDWYEKNRLTLHLSSRVDRVDVASKKVLVGADWHTYDRLVLANGSSAFLPPFKGLPKENVFTLRTLDDAKRIRKAAAGSKRVVVIGGGLLGLETARALATGFPGRDITILEYAEHLLMRQLDHEGAGILQDWIAEVGTKVLAKAETEELLGDGDVATAVKLKDGRVLECDMVVVSAGARSNLRLAKEAGLDVNRGVIVDSSLRTSEEDIYAIGDVAEYGGRVWGMIPPAQDQARIAAKKVLGLEGPDYTGTIPSNILKVMGIDLTSIGTVRSEHETPEAGFEEIRAVTPDRKVYKKFVLKDGKMIGAILLGTKKETGKVAKMIKEGAPVENIRDRLSDPGFDFR